MKKNLLPFWSIHRVMRRDVNEGAKSQLGKPTRISVGENEVLWGRV